MHARVRVRVFVCVRIVAGEALCTFDQELLQQTFARHSGRYFSDLKSESNSATLKLNCLILPVSWQLWNCSDLLRLLLITDNKTSGVGGCLLGRLQHCQSPCRLYLLSPIHANHMTFTSNSNFKGATSARDSSSFAVDLDLCGKFFARQDTCWPFLASQHLVVMLS